MPSNLGSIRSRTIRLGPVSRAACNPAMPSLTAVTWCPSRSRYSFTMRAMPGSSSTTRILLGMSALWRKNGSKFRIAHPYAGALCGEQRDVGIATTLGAVGHMWSRRSRSLSVASGVSEGTARSLGRVHEVLGHGDRRRVRLTQGFQSPRPRDARGIELAEWSISNATGRPCGGTEEPWNRCSNQPATR